MPATQTKAKPILFSGEMVRAILSGAKTQTRRAVKPQPKVRYGGDDGNAIWEFDKNLRCVDGGVSCVVAFQNLPLYCPYGQQGDRLWVRETWAPSIKSGNRQIAYAADGRWGSPSAGGQIYWHGWTTGVTDKAVHGWKDRSGHWVGRGYFDKWRPSIYMPRWASRITLEVTEVRVQRLKEIGWRDALAEGIDAVPCKHDAWGAHGCTDCMNTGIAENPVDEFSRLWDKLNAKNGYGWESNPWVWSISFKRLDT